MDFSEAFRLAKEGSKITREGWNAPGQWVVVQKSYPQGIPINANTAQATGMPEGTVAVFEPYLMLRNAQGAFAAAHGGRPVRAGLETATLSAPGAGEKGAPPCQAARPSPFWGRR